MKWVENKKPDQVVVVRTPLYHLDRRQYKGANRREFCVSNLKCLRHSKYMSQKLSMRGSWSHIDQLKAKAKGLVPKAKGQRPKTPIFLLCL